jgi:putative ABC transport system substrate-binding protein
LGLTLHIQNVRDPDEFDSAFSALTSEHAEALLVLPDPVFYIHRAQIAELAEQNRLPTMFGVRKYVDAGGLISYGVSAPDIDRRIATYADPDINRRVAVSMGTLLTGAQPPEPRMEAPTKFELAINLKTAQALGLTIPQPLLSQADEVIE